jgi:peptide/nickel transport system substrate-binding protein
VRWTLEAARDPVVGYPRAAELADFERIEAPDDSTVALRFAAPVARFPDVLTDLAIAPAHLLDSVPRDRLRQASWNEHPVGNGPFRFVAHEPNRRWIFTANPDFPAALGGPPRLERFIVVVVDEPATKLAALTAGELDLAGIQPAHAIFVARDPDLSVVS